jgi:hypothetical protein
MRRQLGTSVHVRMSTSTQSRAENARSPIDLEDFRMSVSLRRRHGTSSTIMRCINDGEWDAQEVTWAAGETQAQHDLTAGRGGWCRNVAQEPWLVMARAQFSKLGAFFGPTSLDVDEFTTVHQLLRWVPSPPTRQNLRNHSWRCPRSAPLQSSKHGISGNLCAYHGGADYLSVCFRPFRSSPTRATWPPRAAPSQAPLTPTRPRLTG